MPKFRFPLIILSLVLSLTATGCSLQDLLGNKKETSRKQPQEQKQVIAVALNEEDPNKALILKGIEDMAKKENVEIKTISKDTQLVEGQEDKGKSGSKDKKEGDNKEGEKGDKGSKGQEGKSSLQGTKILIYQGGNREILQSAQESKVPILALSELPPGVKPVGVILPDPEKTGVLMGEILMSKVPEGQVIILQGDPNDSVSQEILAGNKKALSKNPKITVQSISNPAGAESVAKQALIEYLQKNPGKVQGIIAHNEKLAAQASEVLKQLQLEKKVQLVGGQACLQSLQRIASGGQIGDIDTSPYIQGVNAFQWAQKIMKKESVDVNDSITGDQGEVPAKVIPVKTVTPENLIVVQKSYAKTLEMTKEQKEDKDKKVQQGGGEQKNQSGDKQGSTGGQGQGQGQAGGNVPQGASKVTERITTVLTREYLDAQGKIIGTEKSTSEQVRTIPPEQLKQETQKGKEGEGKEEGKDKKEEKKEGKEGE